MLQSAKINSLSFLFTTLVSVLVSQTKIISTSFSGYNLSPQNLCNITISNNSGEFSAFIEAKLYNMQGTELMIVRTLPFSLKAGIYNTSQLGITVASVSYLNSQSMEYIKLYNQLPSGKYNYNVAITLNDGSSDQLTEEFESESTTFMSLVHPMDRDTIQSFNPILIWSHGENFSLVQQNEFYRLVLTRIDPGQNAQAAINTQNPLLQINFLTRHDVLYPLDAPGLSHGGCYAWQVQKVVNGVITNRTEAWQFSLQNNTNSALLNFVEVSAIANVTPYKVIGNKIYFVFDEQYTNTSAEPMAFISSVGGRIISVNPTKYKEVNIKEADQNKLQNNRYEIDLKESNLKEGNYTLTILNQKNQVAILKFYYPNL